MLFFKSETLALKNYPHLPLRPLRLKTLRFFGTGMYEMLEIFCPRI
jgi:hypothetical protein